MEEQLGNPATTRDWTVLIFMVPSADLRGNAFDDVDEMKRVRPQDKFHLAVQMHRPSGTERFQIVKGGVRFEKEDPAPDTIAASLTKFVQWGINSLPSKYLMVVLWGHSYGVGLDMFSPRQDLRGSMRTPGMRTLMPRPPLRSLLRPIYSSLKPTGNGQYTAGNGQYAVGSQNGRNGTPGPTNGSRPSSIHSSGSTRRTLSVAALADALEAAVRYVGESQPATGSGVRRRIDILGMDTCYMSSVEAAYQLKDCANYMIASESWIRKQGWDYARTLDVLANQPSIEPEKLGEQIVKLTSSKLTPSISLVDLNETATTTKSTRALVDELLRGIDDDPSLGTAVRSSLAQASFLQVRQFLDLRSVLTVLAREFDGVEPQVDAIMKGLTNMIQAHTATNGGGDKLKGLSIFYPYVEARVSLGALDAETREVNAIVDPETYKELRFPRESRWNDLLVRLDPRETEQEG